MLWSVVEHCIEGLHIVVVQPALYLLLSFFTADKDVANLRESFLHLLV